MSQYKYTTGPFQLACEFQWRQSLLPDTFVISDSDTRTRLACFLDDLAIPNTVKPSTDVSLGTRHRGHHEYASYWQIVCLNPLVACEWDVKFDDSPRSWQSTFWHDNPQTDAERTTLRDPEDACTRSEPRWAQGVHFGTRVPASLGRPHRIFIPAENVADTVPLATDGELWSNRRFNITFDNGTIFVLPKER